MKTTISIRTGDTNKTSLTTAVKISFSNCFADSIVFTRIWTAWSLERERERERVKIKQVLKIKGLPLLDVSPSCMSSICIRRQNSMLLQLRVMLMTLPAIVSQESEAELRP